VSGVRSRLSVRNAPATTVGPQPCEAASSAAPGQGAYTANQFASAYNFTSLYGAGDEGQGIRVALVELVPNLTADIAAYQACYGTSATVNYPQVDGGATSVSGVGYAAEATLDIEDVIGLAPDATIDAYQAPDNGYGLIEDYTAIIDDDTDQVISTSWDGGCDTGDSQAAANAESTLFEQAAVQGQSVFAAAGDSGSTSCGFDTAPAVDDPASQPFVTGVGGLTLSSTSYPPAETVWNDASGAGGGGISSNWAMPSYQSSAPASLNVLNSLSSGLLVIWG
jgi:subtilase family serine protease